MQEIKQALCAGISYTDDDNIGFINNVCPSSDSFRDDTSNVAAGNMETSFAFFHYSNYFSETTQVWSETVNLFYFQ